MLEEGLQSIFNLVSLNVDSRFHLRVIEEPPLRVLYEATWGYAVVSSGRRSVQNVYKVDLSQVLRSAMGNEGGAIQLQCNGCTG